MIALVATVCRALLVSAVGRSFPRYWGWGCAKKSPL
jgi:hypothetical protein